ncbi:MAG: hypothetical protein WCF78_04615 [archaeon]
MNKKIVIGIMLLAFVLLLAPQYFAAGINDTSNLDADTYNYNPNPVISGEEFELWIQLTNNSNSAANNVSYELKSKYPFTVIDFNTTGIIPVLAPHATTIIKYKLRTDLQTTTGTYALEFRAKRGDNDITTVFTYDIDVSGSSAIVDIVSSNIEKATVGGTSNIDLTIKNIGKKDATDIFVTLGDSSDDFVKILNLKTQYLDKLSLDATNTFYFQATVSKDAIKKNYTLPITITFKDSDGDHNLVRSIGLEIKDEPKMVINILTVGSLANNTLNANSDETISLEIYNTGNIDSESVFVEVQTPISNNIRNYFIGSIEKNNYDSVELKFKTLALDKGEYPLTIIVHYKDSSLIEQTMSKTINVNIVESSTGKNSISSIITLILTILGIIIGIAILILIIKWLIRVVFKPAFGGLFGMVKKGKK